MKKRNVISGTVGLLLLAATGAQAALLSLTGRIEMATDAVPIANARVTVTFHGHEMGIHEYTTERRVRVQTDELGNFVAEVKVPDDRYLWTYATVEIAETERSKQVIARSRCQGDDNGGGRCDKNFKVSPLQP